MLLPCEIWMSDNRWQCEIYIVVNDKSQGTTAKHLPSVLWHCWLGGRKGIRPVKNWVVGWWCGCLMEQGADLHMAQLMPLPLTVSCFSKIQIGFTFLVMAHLGSPRKMAIKWVCVCVWTTAKHSSWDMLLHYTHIIQFTGKRIVKICNIWRTHTHTHTTI